MGLARMTTRKPQLADTLLDAAEACCATQGHRSGWPMGPRSRRRRSTQAVSTRTREAMQAVATMSQREKAGGRHGQAPSAASVRLGVDLAERTSRPRPSPRRPQQRGGHVRACTSRAERWSHMCRRPTASSDLDRPPWSSPSQCWPTGTSSGHVHQTVSLWSWSAVRHGRRGPRELRTRHAG